MNANSWARSSSSRCPSWPCRRCTTSGGSGRPSRRAGSWSTPCTERVNQPVAERRAPPRLPAHVQHHTVSSHRRLRRESNRDRRTRRPFRSIPREPRDARLSDHDVRHIKHTKVQRVQGWVLYKSRAAEGRYARRRQVIRFQSRHAPVSTSFASSAPSSAARAHCGGGCGDVGTGAGGCRGARRPRAPIFIATVPEPHASRRLEIHSLETLVATCTSATVLVVFRVEVFGGFLFGALVPRGTRLATAFRLRGALFRRLGDAPRRLQG